MTRRSLRPILAAALVSSLLVLPATSRPARAEISWSDDVGLLARVVAAEAKNEPYAGQVGVAAVILNRVRHPAFPKTIPGVVYQPHAFESVSNGLVWQRVPTPTERQAAIDALSGWDPTYGALYFWNPAKPVSPWIWTRTIVTQIGRHVFAR
ncbi:MAG: cell wall hydrolase [Clostridia bacterium]|nr:cell wall hydrolase [Clostridia bacterium]